MGDCEAVVSAFMRSAKSQQTRRNYDVDLALVLVDNDLLAGMETIDLSIVGELRLDSVDHIAEDIDDLTGGFVWAIGKGLLGDIGGTN